MSTYCVLADKDSWTSKEKKILDRLIDKGLITEVMAVPDPTWRSHEDRDLDRMSEMLASARRAVTEARQAAEDASRSSVSKEMGNAHAAAIIKLQNKVTALEADAAERQVLARKVKQIAKDVEEATFPKVSVSMRCRFCQEIIDPTDVSSTGWLHRATGAVYCSSRARP